MSYREPDRDGQEMARWATALPVQDRTRAELEREARDLRAAGLHAAAMAVEKEARNVR